MSGDDTKIRKTALDLLARREHARSELGTKLAAKSFDEDLVASVLDGLEHEGLLSDARFAEAFVRNRTTKGCGPVRIRYELRERGVHADLIDASLAAEQANWRRHIELARRKRFGSERPDTYTERARQARFLQRRGFTSEQISQAFTGDSFEDDC